jgi:hypothetical protein
MNGSIFKILASLFKRHGIKPVLVGGYAMIAHKIQRMTFDIDFMLTFSDCKKIEADITALGYSILNRTEAFVQFKSEKAGLRDLDFLISDGKTVEKLRAQGQEISIAGEMFTVPSAIHLIEMKLHSMAGNNKREIKDFPDLVHLMSLNKIDPNVETIKKLFVKYNAMALYEKTVKALESSPS